jgi:hypothetical protein
MRQFSHKPQKILHWIHKIEKITMVPEFQAFYLWFVLRLIIWYLSKTFKFEIDTLSHIQKMIHLIVDVNISKYFNETHLWI